MPSSTESEYVQYSDSSQLDNLDRNIWRPEYSRTINDGVTGETMYAVEYRHPSRYYCQEGRDPNFRYILGVDRDDHPDHSSRFGYARGYYGYTSGHFPGKYDDDARCSGYDHQPPGMAPKRFYK
jgi:hypothetical protein